MRHVHRLLRVGIIRLQVAVVMITAIFVIVMVSPALAENPLYCSETVGINQGCSGLQRLTRVNEARNENGGCIAIQMWAKGYGYSEPFEVCSGGVAWEELTVKVESFPKCWNRTNANDTIHCRYSVWSI
jgi:hypothetical protein